jgi:hypothetical protein
MTAAKTRHRSADRAITDQVAAADPADAEAAAPAGSAALRAAPTTVPEPAAQPRRLTRASRMVGGSRQRTTITFYLSDTLRNRARAAYRHTSFEERDGSWSEMLNKALLAEVERRERVHNHGLPFTGSEEPLTPGRPIGY